MASISFDRGAGRRRRSGANAFAGGSEPPPAPTLPRHRRGPSLGPAQGHHWPRTPVFAGLIALAATALGATQSHAFTITRTSSSTFYISTQAASNNIGSMYAAYRIQNTTVSSQPDVWVKLDTFTGGSVALATNEDGLYHLGRMDPGDTKMAYLYLSASAEVAAVQSHTVHIYDRRPDLPGPIELASQVFTFSEVRGSISAGANKVDVVVQGPNPGVLGGTVVLTVQGRTGTVGAGSTLEFSPAGLRDWPADKFEVYAATISFYTQAGSNCTSTLLGTFTDQLTIPWSTTSCYTAIYKLRARSTTTSSQVVSPIVHVASGSNYKHTDPTSLAALDPITPIGSQIRLVKSVSPTTLANGGTP